VFDNALEKILYFTILMKRAYRLCPSTHLSFL